MEKDTKEKICNMILKMLSKIDDCEILSIIAAFIKGIK